MEKKHKEGRKERGRTQTPGPKRGIKSHGAVEHKKRKESTKKGGTEGGVNGKKRRKGKQRHNDRTAEQKGRQKTLPHNTLPEDKKSGETSTRVGNGLKT